MSQFELLFFLYLILQLLLLGHPLLLLLPQLEHEPRVFVLRLLILIDPALFLEGVPILHLETGFDLPVDVYFVVPEHETAGLLFSPAFLDFPGGRRYLNCF